MDKLSLIISCVEYYSHIRTVPGNKVFAYFLKDGVIEVIENTFEISKETNLDFYMSIIDGYLENVTDPEIGDCKRFEERKAVLPEIVKKIEEKFKISGLEALELFYLSNTGVQFSDDSTGLYEKSAEEIFAMLVQEKETEN